MKKLLLIVSIVLWAASAHAANLYVTPSGTGSKTGANWSNALAWPPSFVRGNVYYLSSGSYAGIDFNTPDSGTATISIIGATIANSGTVAGWANSLSVSNADGGSQATFTSAIEFDTDYWVWDGTVGPNWDMNGADYGFAFSSGATNNVTLGTNGNSSTCGNNITSITLNHFYSAAMTGSPGSSSVGKVFLDSQSYGGVMSNLYIGHYLINYWQVLIMTRNGYCGGGGYNATPWGPITIEYGVFENGYSDSCNHGEMIDPNNGPISNMTFRYNYVVGNSTGTSSGCSTAGSTMVMGGNNSDLTNSEIYGNVFNNTLQGDAIISDTAGSKAEDTGGGCLINVLVYNNVFANSFVDDCSVLQANNNGGSGETSSGNVAYNNMFYNITSSCSGPAYSISGSFTHDYNWYEGQGSGASAETHGQTSSSNPFVNNSTTAPFTGFEINADTNAGNTLASPYNVDPLGATRGADGVWDRGAFQYVTSGTAVPMPPTLQLIN